MPLFRHCFTLLGLYNRILTPDRENLFGNTDSVFVYILFSHDCVLEEESWKYANWVF